MSTDLDATLAPFVDAARGRKAEGLVLLDVRPLTTVTDVFLICSGRSNRQVTAIAEHIHTDLKKQAIRPLSVVGRKEGHWVVLDYDYVVVHVFYEPVRQFYNLESLWADAKRIDIGAIGDNALPPPKGSIDVK
jgi:ribosome-associated protein